MSDRDDISSDSNFSVEKDKEEEKGSHMQKKQK